MKREINWQIALGIALLTLSTIVYAIHYAIFRDTHHIFIYMVGDIAFVFAEVLLVTLIIHRLLSEREKRTRLEKLNMVIGAFFSEVGTHLLTHFSDCDPRLDNIRKELLVSDKWTQEEFNKVSGRLRGYDYSVEIDKIELESFTEFLVGKRDFLLRLIENPTLLEHESFTELLRAVFHMIEELDAREDFSDLGSADRAHIANDIKRSYVLLVHQWLEYMSYLKVNYPFLFSFAMRTNPFDQNVSVCVQ